MSLHSMYAGQRGDGKWSWHIKVGDDIVASDAGQGYNNEQDCLHSLFGIFFADWDESFLDWYAKWQSFAGENPPEQSPETEEGAPVRIVAAGGQLDASAQTFKSPFPAKDADAPNYEATSADHADAVAPHRATPVDLGDDPDGDASVDPRDT